MAHLAPLVQDLMIILLTAASVTLLFQKLKLPLVLGYLVAGILVGPFFPFMPNVVDPQNLQAWSEIGIIFLLFSLGLEFGYKKLARVGKRALITGLIEISGVFAASLAVGQILGWPLIESLFLAGALSISSTSIIIRAFSELKLKNRRFVELVYGVLLVEDLVAITFLVLMATLGSSQSLNGWDLVNSVGRLGFFLLLYFVAGTYLVPLVLRKTRKLLSDETLMIFSVGLCLLMVYGATKAGFSSALGAFLMGSILAATPEGPHIEERMVSLRDFFAAIFFVSVGMLINLDVLWENSRLILGLSLFVILAKFCFVTLGSILAGQKIRWSLQSGLAMTQIGEFSFLMASLGATLKVISPRFFPIVVLVSAVTSFATPLLLRALDPIVEWLQHRIPVRSLEQIERYQIFFSPSPQGLRLSLIWRAYGLKALMNSVVIVGISVLMKNLAWPLLIENWAWSLRVLRVAAVVTSVALSLPFYWAILNAQPVRSRHFTTEAWNKIQQMQFALFTARLALTAGLLFFQVVEFLSPSSSFGMLMALFLSLYLLRSRVEVAYRRIESRFLDHLNEKEREELSRTVQVPPLAPWDAQLVELAVHAESPLVGLTFQEACLRERYGITVALIERGRKKILAPNRHERIYPGDRLFVIGNEEEIISARSAFEPHEPEAEGLASDFGLQYMIVDIGSPVIGKTIRDCGLREKVEGLIVGIERGGQRILNPESSFKLEAFDLLWIVGSGKKIEAERRLFENTRPSNQPK